MKIGAFLLALALAFFSSAAFAGVNNLSSDMPTRLDDAYPTSLGSLALQLSSRYLRLPDEESRWELVPNIKYGASPGLQVSVSSRLYAGSANRRGSGDVELKAQYQLNRSFRFPVVALEGTLILPTGKESAGIDGRLKMILSQNLMGESLRLHLSGAWRGDDDADFNGDDQRFSIAFGSSWLVRERTLLVADVFWEEQRRDDAFNSAAELGIRREFAEELTGAAGVSVGIGPESERFSVNIGFQWSHGLG